MPENAGLYQKFDVSRRDGRDRPGGDREGAAYLTIDVVHDPHAAALVLAIANVYHRDPSLDGWSQALRELAAELEAGIENGPRLEQLRTPR